MAPTPGRMRRRDDTDPEHAGDESDAKDSSFLGRIMAARDRAESPWLLVVAVAVFIAFTVLAIRSAPADPQTASVGSSSSSPGSCSCRSSWCSTRSSSA